MKNEMKIQNLTKNSWLGLVHRKIFLHVYFLTLIDLICGWAGKLGDKTWNYLWGWCRAWHWECWQMTTLLQSNMMIRLLWSCRNKAVEQKAITIFCFQLFKNAFCRQEVFPFNSLCHNSDVTGFCVLVKLSSLGCCYWRIQGETLRMPSPWVNFVKNWPK